MKTILPTSGPYPENLVKTLFYPDCNLIQFEYLKNHFDLDDWIINNIISWEEYKLLLLRYKYYKTYDEIALCDGVSRETIRLRLNSLISRLRKNVIISTEIYLNKTVFNDIINEEN